MIAKFLLCLALVAPSLAATLPYIIGGTKVSSASTWPHQCSLQRSGSHSCGASIISSTWVLTAAHCVGSPSLHKLVCGTTDRYDSTISRGASMIIKHENYQNGPGAFPNDIAVIKLQSALVMSEKVKAIAMWEDSDGSPAGNSDCYISGWGYTKYGNPLPQYLQEAKINVYDQTECKRKMGSSSINDGHVCIGDPTNGRGSCNGDSGGPLVCKTGGQYKLVGATSFGRVFCPTNYYSVYTRVSYFRDWVKGKTGV